MEKGEEILFKDESYRIMGACFEVYKEEGCGFVEEVYQESLEMEFGYQDIPAIPKPHLDIAYKGVTLKKKFEPDFVCFGKIVVELKAVKKLLDEHRAQLFNYLKAGNFQLGLLVNFGHHPQVEWERIVRTSNPKEESEFSLL